MRARPGRGDAGAVSCISISMGGVDIMKRLVLAILVVLSLAVAADAQTFRGAINGTVTDPSGAVVPNATVKATENATGIDHTTVTTSDGVFSFQDIPLGFYKVSVTALGFPEGELVRGLVLVFGKTIRLFN